jgi:hypothetical protein
MYQKATLAFVVLTNDYASWFGDLDKRRDVFSYGFQGQLEGLGDFI